MALFVMGNDDVSTQDLTRARDMLRHLANSRLNDVAEDVDACIEVAEETGQSLYLRINTRWLARLARLVSLLDGATIVQASTASFK